MAKTRGFPLKGDLVASTFTKCWESLTMRQRMEIRNLADGHDMTLIQVLNRWPELRVDRKVTA